MPAPASVPPALRDAILTWYDARGRALAFRGTHDPYAILVSELMAQQTQISRVAEAWQRWMTRFPSVASLAAATPADVLRQWAGLGYNTRAINLHRAAKAIVAEHGGRVPDTVEGLLSLPGVGPYTARAVAAIAFGRAVGAVDTNVRRVLGRALAGADDGLAPAALQAVADAAVPAGRPADWTHALMDVGATFCTPRRPRCAGCPARAWCVFAAADPRAGPVPVAARPPQPAFAATTRWLRGRIVAHLRERDGWSDFDQAIGPHGRVEVHRALEALAADGVVELDAGAEPPRARLPLT